jgi:hypothetical protein
MNRNGKDQAGEGQDRRGSWARIGQLNNRYDKLFIDCGEMANCDSESTRGQ